MVLSVLARDKPSPDSGAVFGYILPADVRNFLLPDALCLFQAVSVDLVLASLLIIAGLGDRAKIDVKVDILFWMGLLVIRGVE